MCEQYHCEDGWLPTDGEVDEDDGLQLLWPTEYRPCFCSESNLLPEGVRV